MAETELKIQELEKKVELLFNKYDEVSGTHLAIALLQEREGNLAKDLDILRKLEDTNLNKITNELSDIEDSVTKIRDDKVISHDIIHKSIRDNKAEVDSYVNKATGAFWLAGIMSVLVYSIAAWFLNQGMAKVDNLENKINASSDRVSEYIIKNDKKTSDLDQNVLDLWRKPQADK